MAQVTLTATKRSSGSYPRIDGAERVTGGAKYGGDWKVPGMLYARIVQSTIPHGRVKAVEASGAAGMPGVMGIITCLDDDTIWHAGERKHERRVFADRVRFVGDCIAAVAATTRTVAREAAAAIEVDYDELPAVVTVEESRKDGAAKIWDDGNMIGPMKYGFGDSKASFAGADFVLEADYETSRVHNAPLEPATSLAWWEEDRLTVVAGTQAIHTTREGIAKDLNIPIERVRVVTLYKGGGFGNKNRGMNYDAVAALLSKKTGRPVMVEYSRLEDFTGVHGRWSSVQHLRCAVKKADLRLLAIDLKAFCDIGAYARAIPTSNLVEGPEGYYGCESWSAEVYGVYTNTPSTGHMRAPTGPHSCFATESLTDEVSNALGVNPLEFRLRNSVVKHHNKEPFSSNGLNDCLKLGAEAIGWDARWHAPPKAQLNPGRRLTGLGVAVAAWHATVGSGEAVLRMTRDGILEVCAGVVDIGTGAKTTMAVIASTTLGIPLEHVRVIWGDTDVSPPSVGESGSRTTSFTGTAVREAAVRVKQRLLQLASARLRQAPSDLRVDDARIVARDGRAVGIAELVTGSGQEVIEERVTTQQTLPEHTERSSFAAHFAEVEVDAETGLIEVRKYVAAHESGTIINRLTSESQVQGAVIMGLGMSLSERVILDSDFGSMQNSSFLTYRLPNVTNMPKIEVIFAEMDDPYGPKSVGEIGIVPVPAVIGNAVFNATGVRLRRLPFTAEALLKGMDSTL